MSYLQVAEELRRRIHSGEYGPGDRIPSTSQLQEEFDCANTTIQRAIRELKREGIVEGATGSGVFVRTVRPVMHVTASYVTQVGDQPRASWKSEAERLGMRGDQRITHVGTVEAPPEIAVHLGVDEGEPVAIRRRVMLLDGEPVQLADSYYPLDLAQGTPLAAPGKLVGGTVGVLESLVELGDFEEKVRARAATADEQRDLKLNPGAIVLVMIRTTLTTDGRPVEVGYTVLTADRHELCYRLPARA
ncbi:GntR family transcriptional regulator [Allonocardiopsis opalescens]|uniref:GntR family transcriptional regulator n=1 Tax=Allonocardiopsis opalescens TaxID=1144618 RepID=UPI001472CFCE|nr:GntR family transcriptional regulator [Allonocardiopsis opalescens]